MNPTLEYVAEVEKRAKAATPGPWATKIATEVYTLEDVYFSPSGGKKYDEEFICENAERKDSAFIAASRTDVPKLCSLVRDMVERLAVAEAALNSTELRLDKIFYDNGVKSENAREVIVFIQEALSKIRGDGK